MRKELIQATVSHVLLGAVQDPAGMGSTTPSMAKKFQGNTKEVTKSLQNEARPHLRGEIVCLQGLNIKLRLLFLVGKGQE